MTYAFIGLGNMAGAILRGMKLSGGFQADALVGYDADPRQMDKLNKATGIAPTGSVREAVKQADVVVLAVKPQIMPAVLQEMAGSLSGQLVITIAAGLPLTYYEDMLGSDTPLVRVMPSLNARALAACSAVCANAQATATQLDTAKKLFAAVGTVHEVPEKLFPAFSALAGAAPAFAFEMVDALASAGVKAGLARPLAQQVAAEMLLGSGKLLVESGEHPRQLMDQVCSPGGTTIEGVHALSRWQFDHALHEAVNAVIEKDAKLGGGK